MPASDFMSSVGEMPANDFMSSVGERSSNVDVSLFSCRVEGSVV